MLYKFKQQKYSNHLDLLPKITLSANDITFLSSPIAYRQTLVQLISQAKYRIYLIALYLEQDDAGNEILSAIYKAKQANPNLEVAIFVDWHRAQRGRIGDKSATTNRDWYCTMKQHYGDVTVPIYGVPVNTREALGVLHLKGNIIDDTVIYSGASINDVYLHYHNKYRYDRYQLITNHTLANTMIDYVKSHLQSSNAVKPLDVCQHASNAVHKKQIKHFRQNIKNVHYAFQSNATNDELALTPLVGLSHNSQLNKVILSLLGSVQQQVTICTPYFNLPHPLVKAISRLLVSGKKVEIIVGDKVANDFYIPENEPFRMIGALPYLYETNLRKFARKFQHDLDKGTLTIRLWCDKDNSYHLKGIWIDDKWLLLTGNNLNPRAMRLDLENGILIHDPHQQLTEAITTELTEIRHHTTRITHYKQLQNECDYPTKVRKLLRRLRRVGLNKLISRIL